MAPSETTSVGKTIMVDNERGNFERIRSLTQETRLAIIQIVLGHPCMMPSIAELSYYLPSVRDSTISEHVDVLEEIEVIERVKNPRRKRDEPGTFVFLTDPGYELLEQHNILLPQIGEIRRDIAQTERIERIYRYERAARPTVSVSYDHPLAGDGEVVDPTDYCGEAYPEYTPDENSTEGNPNSRRVIGRPH